MSKLCRRSILAVAMALAIFAIAPLAAQDTTAPAPGEEGRVILSWEKFRELTRAEREPGAAPKLVLPWAEVQDLLGVTIEDESLAGAELELDWRQFRALLEWSVARKPDDKKPAPPADYIIGSSEYGGTLTEDGASFTLTMTVDVLREEGWKVVPVLPVGVALTKAELPDGCFLNSVGGSYSLLTQATGRMEVNLTFAVSVSESGGIHQTRFETVPSSVSTLQLKVARPDVDIKVAGAQAVVPIDSGQEGVTVVGAPLLPGAPVTVSWERALAEKVAVPTKLYAQTRTLMLVGEGIVTCHETVDLSVLHTPVRSVSFRVPDGVGVLDVTGGSVTDWNATGQELTVRFGREIIGSTSMNLTFELAASDTDSADITKWEVPVLGVEGAVREKGFVGVVAAANVEISADEGVGAKAIDVRQLPPEILRMTSQPVLLAYRYIGAGRSVPLVVQRHKDVKVLVTIVDAAQLTIMQTEDGPRIIRALYTVRNNRNQFLRMKMPEGADVWSVSVAGNSVRPAQDSEGRVLVPLVRSGAGQDLSAFTVEVIYVENGSMKPADKGTMRIGTPTLDDAVTHMMVQLYLPSEGDYSPGLWGKLSFESPLKLVKEFTRLRMVGGGAAVDAVQQGEMLQKAFNARAEQQAQEAGVTPIRVNLPIRGEVFNFEKILVLGEDISIQFSYTGWAED